MKRWDGGLLLSSVAVGLILSACGGSGESGSSSDDSGVASQNTTPVANAGSDLAVVTNRLVTLDGSVSSDVDSDSLTYSWTMTTKPSGSSTALTNDTSVDPTFVPDVDGTYVILLVVNDGTVDSSSDSVTVVAGEAGGIIHNGFVYSTLVSPETGKTWLDRNLGASMRCSESRDSGSFADDDAYVASQQDCFGDYYQWGRPTDGHEKSDSNITTTRATTITPGHGDFISIETLPYDWTTVDRDGSSRAADWNPCPTGYRVPTIEELLAENIIDRDDAYIKLKLPLAGGRYSNNGVVSGDGGIADVWSASPKGDYSDLLVIGHSDAWTYPYTAVRSTAFSVRCLKD